jgi:hypothetical protein
VEGVEWVGVGEKMLGSEGSDDIPVRPPGKRRLKTNRTFRN